MLEAAGVTFDVLPANLDEESLKSGANGADEIAASLAAAKAESISRLRPESWVIGSDSVVVVDQHVFGKPRSRDDAAAHLRFFAGREMNLTSAVALARGGETEWLHAQSAQLQVRELSERFIIDYLDAEWPEVGYTVGVFRLEGRGVQLFHSIEGDHFTILGMPLIPLLRALRDRGLLLT